MSKRVLLSSLLLGLAACPAGLPDREPASAPDDNDNDNDDDDTADESCSCVEGQCLAPDEVLNFAPEAPRSQPEGLERLGDAGACQQTGTDEQARATGYTCNGTEQVVVTYDGDSARLATITVTTGETTDRRTFTWVDDRLQTEVREYLSSGATQQRRSFTLAYDGDVVVGLSEEIVGPQAIVLLRGESSWDTAGRVQRVEQRNGNDVLTYEVEFHWAGDTFLGATTTHHDIDPASAPGCTEVEPRVMVCELTLLYGDTGAPTSATVDGETVPVSDQCCRRAPCPG